MTKLQEPEVRREFAIELKNRSSCLVVQDTDRDGEGDNEMELDDQKTKWENIKKINNESARTTGLLGKGRSKAG